MRIRSETLSQVREQLALLPDGEELSPKCDIDSADVNKPGASTPEDERKLGTIPKYHRAFFLGEGNAVPTPARGEPRRSPPRSVAPHLSAKVYELLEKPLEARLIEHSDSAWPSHIVTVLKTYPNFMSLVMASGFWAVKMSERVKLISAFGCPFGHFQWTRMPFGLQHSPLIYQSVINNFLQGFVRLPPEEEGEVEQDVVDFLGLDPIDNQ
ncbi:reverse transcriptase [Phytophthora megakarya]|uniref:Reverse transcriptase n=1 Tax=Phytophthora megakarya TaxID=4795 RepID=A0A225W821_9STRA|nr:reverse transcriptase [Phytophthora megakarya]